MNNKLDVRSLLIESRVRSNFDIQYERFRTVAKRLHSLSESRSTVRTLVEGSDLSVDDVNEQLKESSKEFAKARKLLSEVRDCDNFTKVNENLKKVNSILNLLESDTVDIENSLHETVDLLEGLDSTTESKKKSLYKFLYESLNLQFKQLVYITGVDADRGFEILDKTKSKKQLLQYLKNFLSSNPEMTNKSESSREDEKFRFKDYIVFMNRRDGYIGVEKVLST